MTNDIEIKAQSSQWKRPEEPRPKKACQVRSNVKVLLTVFFNCNGVVYQKFLPQGRTVNKDYYHEVMQQMCTELWKNESIILHHVKTPAHTSMLMHDVLAKSKTVIMPHLPYLPDLFPSDLFLFPKLKTTMKGKRFATIEEIKEKCWRFQKARFKSVSRIGKNAGLSVLYLRGFLWKGKGKNTLWKQFENNDYFLITPRILISFIQFLI